jgi:hypothetical protein
VPKLIEVGLTAGVAALATIVNVWLIVYFLGAAWIDATGDDRYYWASPVFIGLAIGLVVLARHWWRVGRAGGRQGARLVRSVALRMLVIGWVLGAALALLSVSASGI